MCADLYIEFLSYLKVGLDIPYMTLQGITRSLSEYIKIHARNTLYQYKDAFHGEEKEVKADHSYK
ncbi:MAG: hypothetical protein QXO39_07060 [Conexivisphaerales archaeon]